LSEQNRGDPVQKGREQAPVTRLLQNWSGGNADGAGPVIANLYVELHRIAERALRDERACHTLQPTALINELYLRLDASHPPEWRDRQHFFAVAANTVRRILIDYARASAAERRGGDQVRVPLEDADAANLCAFDDLIAVDQALMSLEGADPRAARVTELRFFGGLQESEIAAELGISEITVKRDWKFARAWLAAHLGKL
jgi:RNA polymerase sigma-70 factor (ECF subfamily)